MHQLPEVLKKSPQLMEKVTPEPDSDDSTCGALFYLTLVRTTKYSLQSAEHKLMQSQQESTPNYMKLAPESGQSWVRDQSY